MEEVKGKLLEVLRGTAMCCDKCGSYKVYDSLADVADLATSSFDSVDGTSYRMLNIICDDCGADYTRLDVLNNGKEKEGC